MLDTLDPLGKFYNLIAARHALINAYYQSLFL